MPEDKQPVRKPAVDKGWHGTRSGAGAPPELDRDPASC